MIKYPKGLPRGLQSGRSYQIVSPLERSQLSSGRARQRRRFTSVPEMASISWIFTPSQGQAFEAWFRDALIDGSEWFECELKTPLGLSDHQCRFNGIYSGPSIAGNNLWSYSAELELKFRAVAPAGEGLFTEDILTSEIFDLTINREWPKA